MQLGSLPVKCLANMTSYSILSDTILKNILLFLLCMQNVLVIITLF